MNVPDGEARSSPRAQPWLHRSRHLLPRPGMPREHDYLARHGYVVLHTDYRGHTSSDNDKDVDYELRLPYAVDTINAVLAVKSSKLRFLDKDQVGWLGRSMGGGVVERARGPAGPRRCRRHLRFREARWPPTTGSSSTDHRRIGREPTDGWRGRRLPKDSPRILALPSPCGP